MKKNHRQHSVRDKRRTPGEGLGNDAPDRAHQRTDSRFSKLVTLWVPRRFTTPEGVDVRSLVFNTNETILRRGFVLSDGQVLATPISDVAVSSGVVTPEVIEFQGRVLTRQIRIGEQTEIVCEHIAEGSAFEVPPRREWLVPQRAFFQLENPYQMAEESGDYTWSHLTTRVIEPYLSPDERIAAVLHGEVDQHYFRCFCHLADVVYTTRHRLVCMACGATHAVLRDALSLQPKRLLTAEEWLEYFDEDGSRHYEEVNLSIVDFREVENAPAIWRTNQWDEATREFVFFARLSPEDVSKAIRGTEADSSILLEAGFTPVETPPPPAYQVSEGSLDVDLVENASHALREGVASFLKARKRPEALVNAIPQLFRALELLLKAKLQAVDAGGLGDRPNNPTVLKRLMGNGIHFAQQEVDVLHELRRLRNDRAGLAVSRGALLLLNRFSYEELGLWLGDTIPPDSWYEVLRIRELSGTAREVVATRLESLKKNPEANISPCERCGELTNVRPHPNVGASCLLCGYVSIRSDADWIFPE